MKLNHSFFILIVLISIKTNSFSQPFSDFKQISTTISFPNDICSSDLDNDGDHDMLLSANDKILWLKNLGGGLISGELIISSQAAGVIDITAADLDGDGDEDVLAALYSFDKIVWFKNLGNGMFSSEQIITNLTDAPKSVHFADLDGDGDLDVLSASYLDDKIAWYKNIGGGLFSNQLIISTQTNGATNVCTSDIDGDGDQDIIATATLDNKIVSFQNLGAGLFSNQILISTTSTSNDTQIIYTVDLDGDIDQDILAYSSFSNKLFWFKNLGGGAFSNELVISSNNNFGEINYADLDGDGDQDIIASNISTDKLVWYKNLGGGAFSSEQVINSILGSSNSLIFIDIDGDSVKDIFSAMSTLDFVCWYKNLGGGIFSALKWISFIQNPDGVTSADLDGDGVNDVLSGTTWYKNLNGGKFSAMQSISNPSGLSYNTMAADLDGDGDQDILGVDSKVSWWRNLGAGVFSNEILTPSINPSAKNIDVTDIDGDGDLDIISAGTYLMVHKNLGGGVFSNPQIVSNFLSIISTTPTAFASDLDNDGDKDLITSIEDGKISWFKNIGGGLFSNELVIANQVQDFIVSLLTFDIDGDGDQDVLASTNDDLLWFRNLGGGVFSSQQIIDNNPYLKLFCHDIDSDGDQDILTASDVDDKISWYQNIGGGAFSNEQVISIQANGANDVFAADIDGDGFKDILSSSINDHKIAWYENLKASNTCSNSNEPNETSATAASINTGVDVTGQIASSLDKDYLKFTTTGINDVLISLTTLPANYDIRIYDAAGNQIGVSQNTGINNESIYLTGLSSGTYTVYIYGVAGANSSSGCYTLKTTTTPSNIGVCANSNEPNETMSSAKLIPINSDVLGQIATSSDRDFLKYTLTTTSNVVISLTFLPANLRLNVYNTGGTQIGSSNNSGTLSENIILNNQAPGTYTVRVMGVSGASSNTSCYTLKVNATPTGANPVCTNSFEPNESLSSAQVISTGIDIKGQIANATDKDYLKFTTTSTGNVDVRLSGLPADYDLKLYNASAVIIGSSSAGGTSQETIYINNLAAGTYTVYIYGYSGASSTTTCYNLKVTTSGGGVRMAGQKSDLQTVLDTEIQNAWNLFPNPTQSTVNIALSSSQTQEVQIKVMNYMGSLVYSNPWSVIEGENIKELNLSTLSKGVYIVLLESAQGTQTQKLIVE